jgi:hypothetical protein
MIAAPRIGIGVIAIAMTVSGMEGKIGNDISA